MAKISWISIQSAGFNLYRSDLNGESRFVLQTNGEGVADGISGEDLIAAGFEKTDSGFSGPVNIRTAYFLSRLPGACKITIDRQDVILPDSQESGDPKARGIVDSLAESDVEMRDVEIVNSAESAASWGSKVKDTMSRIDNSSNRFLWFQDPEINRVIDKGVELGWLKRPSHTQVEWTEEGVRAVSQAAEEVHADTEQEAEVPGAAEAVSDADRFFQASKSLIPFVSKDQLKMLHDGSKGEEKEFFLEKIQDISNTVVNMPATYDQKGKGDDAIVYLHYFKGGSDWYIIEKDAGGPDDEIPGQQTQAFGYAILNEDKDNAEMGYINIDELVKAGVEIDLHWTPKKLGEVQKVGATDTDLVGQDEINVGDIIYFPTESNLRLAGVKEEIEKKALRVSKYKVVDIFSDGEDKRIKIAKTNNLKKTHEKYLDDEFLEIVSKASLCMTQWEEQRETKSTEQPSEINDAQKQKIDVGFSWVAPQGRKEIVKKHELPNGQVCYAVKTSGQAKSKLVQDKNIEALVERDTADLSENDDPASQDSEPESEWRRYIMSGHIKNNRTHYKEVAGKAVDLEGYDGFSFVLGHNENGFFVFEETTGLALSANAVFELPEQAAEEAKRMLDANMAGDHGKLQKHLDSITKVPQELSRETDDQEIRMGA